MIRRPPRSTRTDTLFPYTPLFRSWHKVHAGLIDAYRIGHVEAALPVMLGMAGYLATILEGLDDAEMQTLLAAEYGGLNESYADTFAITGDPRWLDRKSTRLNSSH